MDIGCLGKCRKGVSESEQLQLLTDNSPVKACANLFRGQVGSVDLLVTVYSGTVHGIIIIFPCKQIKIPDLGPSRHEKLNCPCGQHSGVFASKCAVIGCIDLIIYVFGAVQVFDIATVCDNRINNTLDVCLRQ